METRLPSEEAVAPLSQAETAYQEIEEMIVTRALRPGGAISEKKLCAELGCGRTPVREALQRLRLEGYVEIMPSRGARVAPADAMSQLDLLEVRRPMERLLVSLAAKRATGEQRNEIRELIGGLSNASEAGDRGAFLAAIREFQWQLCLAAHNGLLTKTMRVIQGQSRWFWFSALATDDNMRRAAELHGTTLQAVADGEIERATTAAAEFLDFLEGLTREVIERRMYSRQPGSERL